MNQYFYLIFIALILLGCNTNVEQAKVFIPFLKDFPMEKVSFCKIDNDPSYIYPYTVYIKISIDSSSAFKLMKALNLKNSFGEDDENCHRIFPINTYTNFFTMTSINSTRSSSILTSERTLGWWPLFANLRPGEVHSSPYLDSRGGKCLTNFQEDYNGRIAAAYYNSSFYILIDCWG